MQEMQVTWVWSLSWDILEQRMTTHSSILTWKIPWTEEAGGWRSIGLQRVRHDCSVLGCMHVHPATELLFYERSSHFGSWFYILFLCVSIILSFKNGLLDWLLLSFNTTIYILYTSPLSEMWFAIISSQSFSPINSILNTIIVFNVDKIFIYIYI